MDIYRQGDVIITPSKVPKGAKLTGNEVRIASETGNTHVPRRGRSSRREASNTSCWTSRPR